MLLTLLPLAGWASTNLNSLTIKFGGTGVGDETVTYTGNDLIETITIALHPESGSDITYDPANPKFTFVWSQGTQEVTEIKNVGKYTVTVTGNGSDVYGDPISRDFWVLKAANAASNTGTVGAGGTYADAPVAGYELVATAPTVGFGTIQYLVTETSATPLATATGWTDTAPKSKKVGTHYVWFKVDGIDNYAKIDPTAVGTGSVTITGTNIADGDFTAPVQPTAVTIDFDNSNHVVYTTGGSFTGESLGTFKYTADGGTTWTTTIPQVKDATAYTVNWKIEGKEGYNDKVGTEYTFTINKVAPAMTEAAKKATGTLAYTGQAQKLLSEAATASLGATTITYTIGTAATVDGPYDYTGATEYTDINDVKATKAGFYQVKAEVKAYGNYLNSSNSLTTNVEIKKVELTVHTTNATKVFGQADPASFAATYDGFVNNETATTALHFVAPTLSRDKAGTSAGENVGEYLISADNTTGSADNYTFKFVEANYGKFTITPKPLSKTATEFTWTLDAETKTYDGTKQTKTVATAKFLKYAVSGTDVAVDLVPPTDFSYVTDNAINAGTNAQVIVTGQGNYQGTIVLNFTINKADAYIIPQNASKNYGTADPALTWKVVKASDGTTEIPNTDLKGTVELARQAGESVSTYIIYVKSYTAAANDNYNPINVFNAPTSTDAKNKTAAFTINQAGDGLVLKFKDDAVMEKYYGDANPGWTIADLEYVSGLVGTDTWDAVKPTLSAPTFAIASEHVKDNATNVATATGMVSTNYPSVTVQPKAFTVKARPIAIEVSAQIIDYGAELGQAVTTNWAINDANSRGGDWNGNSTDVASNAVLGLTLSTVNDAASYAPGATYEKAIKATITNLDYTLNDKCVWGNLTINAEAAFILADTDHNLDTKLTSVDDQSYAVKFGNMPIEAQKWYAMVLPFATTPEELVNKLGTFLIVNRISSATIDDATKEVTVKFGLEWNEIPAGVPFLIKTAKATNWNKTVTVASNEFSARKLYVAIPGETKGKASFLGTYAWGKSLRWGYDLDGNVDPGFEYIDAKTTDWSKAINKYRYLDVNDQKWYNQKNSAQTLKPMEAYLKLDSEALSARIFVEDFENGTTAIKSLSTDDIEGLKTSEGWYTIDGIRLQGAPTEKGIYINNGKKVVVK